MNLTFGKVMLSIIFTGCRKSSRHIIVKFIKSLSIEKEKIMLKLHWSKHVRSKFMHSFTKVRKV